MAGPLSDFSQLSGISNIAFIQRALIQSRFHFRCTLFGDSLSTGPILINWDSSRELYSSRVSYLNTNGLFVKFSAYGGAVDSFFQYSCEKEEIFG